MSSTSLTELLITEICLLSIFCLAPRHSLSPACNYVIASLLPDFHNVPEPEWWRSASRHLVSSRGWIYWRCCDRGYDRGPNLQPGKNGTSQSINCYIVQFEVLQQQRWSCLLFNQLYIHGNSKPINIATTNQTCNSPGSKIFNSYVVEYWMSPTQNMECQAVYDKLIPMHMYSDLSRFYLLTILFNVLF